MKVSSESGISMPIKNLISIVATVAIGNDGAINAALIAASIIGNTNKKVKDKLNSFRAKQTRSVKKKPK